MQKISIGNIVLACLLGFLIGSVGGTILDRLLNTGIFAMPLLKEALRLELYTIKIEIQITPASLAGMVVTGYLVLKKG